MRWQNVYSECFGIAHGVRQGGVLSPYLFKLYIKDFLKSVIGCNIGCNIAGRLVNINTKTLQFNKYCKGLPVKASKQQKSFWG